MIERARRNAGTEASRRTRSHLRYLPVLLALWDGGLTYGSFALAYWIRYTLKIGPAIQSQVSFADYQPVGLILLVVTILVLLLKGAYRFRLSRDTVDEVSTMFSTVTIAVSIVVVISALLHSWEYSRAVIAYVWLLSIVALTSGRVVFRGVQGWLHRKGWGVSRVLVVGGSDIGKMVMQSMMSRRDLGYQPAGFVYEDGAGQQRDFGRFPALGSVADVPHLLDSGSVDEVVVALPASEHDQVLTILQLCEHHGIGLKLIPDLFEMSLSRVNVDGIAGVPLLDVRESALRPFSRAVKRAMDIVVATLGLLATLPIVLVVGLLIRLESPGPAFVLQERVGLSGKRFRCVKLRSMAVDAESMRPSLAKLNEMDGPVFKIRADPRRTKVGRRIRRWSVDELPNFWNVLRGDMSIVGPRPALPQEVDAYDDWHRRRLEVKPGMTGVWQVSGRSDLPFDEMLLMDIYYVDNWSISLDIRIMLRTVLAVLGRKGAY
ncbi:MAG TPA: sugar transferase [Chloroflexota bacterium]|nr:sugar transferase [Chloroflexota bacterium]